MLFKYLPPERIDVLYGLKIRFTPLLSLNDPFEYSVKIGPNIYELEENSSTDETKFVSLSRNNTNLLMWSHYTDCHRGFCIGFKRDHNYFSKAESVRYRRLRYNFNGARDEVLSSFPAGKAIALEKAVDWAYEEEERLFLCDVPLEISKVGNDQWGREVHLNNYPSDCIAAIYIGMRASQSLTEDLIKAAMEISPKIKIYRATKSRTEFKINFRRIKIEWDD